MDISISLSRPTGVKSMVKGTNGRAMILYLAGDLRSTVECSNPCPSKYGALLESVLPEIYRKELRYFLWRALWLKFRNGWLLGHLEQVGQAAAVRGAACIGEKQKVRFAYANRTFLFVHPSGLEPETH
jgi:hypothetical protein